MLAGVRARPSAPQGVRRAEDGLGSPSPGPGGLSGSWAPHLVLATTTNPTAHSLGLSSSWSSLLYPWRLWASCPPLPGPSFRRKGCTWPLQHLVRLPAHGRCPSHWSMDLRSEKMPCVPLCVPGELPPSGGLGGLGEPPTTPEPSACCGHLAADRGGRGRKGSEARPGAASNAAVLPSFRDCLCVTARRLPSALPRGGCRPWPQVLTPTSLLCQAALGSWGAPGA